ncbi:hypothetical protein KPH14_006272 [Odynerus spinipes]|uniref:Uncharacterized protein n=1 Tax=Odynerus spinipes TaxID=1348599 RepID=A0AAD9RCV3_9HYME|nr:hypothetical protein KPH14_006272 [Odynerus spinipes]
MILKKTEENGSEKEVNEEIKETTKNNEERIDDSDTEMDNNMEDDTEKKEENEDLGRGKRIKWLPWKLQDYATCAYEERVAYALSAEEFVDNVPQSYEEIQDREDKEIWKQALDIKEREKVHN